MQHTVTLDSKSRVSLARVGGRPGQKLVLHVDGQSFVLEPPVPKEDADWQPRITLKELYRSQLSGWEPGRMPEEKTRKVRL